MARIKWVPALVKGAHWALSKCSSCLLQLWALCSLFSTLISLVTFINKCWKTLDQSRSAPCHQHRWERGPNMWTEPTGIMNKIPVSTHCRLAHPQMPRDHKAVPRHSSWPFLIEWSPKVRSPCHHLSYPNYAKESALTKLASRTPVTPASFPVPWPESKSGLKSLQYWHFEEANSFIQVVPCALGY